MPPPKKNVAKNRKNVEKARSFKHMNNKENACEVNKYRKCENGTRKSTSVSKVCLAERFLLPGRYGNECKQNIVNNSPLEMGNDSCLPVPGRYNPKLAPGNVASTTERCITSVPVNVMGAAVIDVGTATTNVTVDAAAAAAAVNAGATSSTNNVPDTTSGLAEGHNNTSGSNAQSSTTPVIIITLY